MERRSHVLIDAGRSLVADGAAFQGRDLSGGTRDWTVRLLGNRVVVSPDPFDGAVIPVSINARSLPNRVYESAEALQAAWDAAPTTTLRGEVKGS